MNGRVDPEEYVRAIEAEFVRRRGAPLLLSPKDWALIRDWREAGIPLRIVLQGIGNVFDAFERRAPPGRRIHSISYCRQEILGLHHLYRTLQGASGGSSTSSAGEEAWRVVARHLGRLRRRVREAMARASDAGFDGLVAALARAASDLGRLGKETRAGRSDPQRLEATLHDMDEALLAAGRAALPDEEARATNEEVARALASERHRMSPAAYEVTQRSLQARRLRRLLFLPRLTLFD